MIREQAEERRRWGSGAYTSFGVDITVPCDCVVDASNMVAGTSLADELSGDFDVVAVGDCPTPLNIQNAITTANLAARRC